MLAYIIVSLFIIIGFKKLFFSQKFAVLPFYIFLYIAFIALMSFMIYKIYKMIGLMYKTLTIIIADISYSRNIKRSRYILNNLLITITLFIVAIFFPLIIMPFNIPYLNIIPFIFLIFVFIKLKNVTDVIESFQSEIDNFPKYKKISEMQKA